MKLNEKMYENLRLLDKTHNYSYFEDVINLIEEKEIPIQATNIHMTNAVGLTLPDKIHINKWIIEKLINYNDNNKYFVLLFTVLHEIAHYMRIHRKPIIIDLNNSNFDIFYNCVKLEETIANKYAEQGFIRIVGRKCHEVNHMYGKIYNNDDKMRDMYFDMFTAIHQSKLEYFDFMNKYFIN